MYSMSIALTPAQAVKIHGWIQPSRRLSWEQVCQRDDLTFYSLFVVLCDGIHTPSHRQHAVATLHTLQPSLQEWICRGKVTLEDCEVLHMKWDVNFTRDFPNMSIGNILMANMSHEAMVRCKMDVDILINQSGMTPDIMSLFHFSPRQWVQLGLRYDHIKDMSDALMCKVFGVPRHMVEAELPLLAY